MSVFRKLEPPAEGTRITLEDDRVVVPDNPIIPFIEGDGIGSDITAAMKVVLDAAVARTYGGQRRIVWFEIFAGEKAQGIYGDVLPQDTYRAIEHYVVAIKGPLTTPVAGGYRSLNVSMRQKLNLYACVRPARYYPGVPSPVRQPKLLNVVIFRENTEDVYAGIEWEQGTPEVQKVISFLNNQMGTHIREDSGIGIKPISVTGTKRLVRKAIRYAIEKKRPSVTLVHKGNIMKFTEGAFRDWGYELAMEEFREQVITEDELWDMIKGADGVTPTKNEGAFAHLRDGRPPGDPGDRIIIKDRIADAMFQQVLTRPAEYSVIALPNLNGDYLSDACAAQVGGLGMAPGGNIGDSIALFEATHGSAPKYRGMDKVNPGSLILSGAMMLEYLRWDEAAEAIRRAIGLTIEQKKVTYDLARLMEDVEPIRTSEFARAIADNL